MRLYSKPIASIAVLGATLAGVATQAVATADPAATERAIESCRAISTGIASRQEPGVADQEKSNADQIGIVWPSSGDKPPISCTVARQTAKVMFIEVNGRVIPAATLARVAVEAQRLREVDAGNYGPFVDRAKARLTMNFKDPATAQFRGLYIGGGALTVLCGEVNAKNSYGAYVGFRRFYASDVDGLSEVEKPGADHVFQAMWPRTCGERKAELG